MNDALILLIDDEPRIADVVVYALESRGFRVRTAPDGTTGLRLFRDLVPDLVLLDLNLPDMSGLDLFHELRRARAGVPIIMLTCRSDEVDRVLGLEMGADDYVTKPFSPRELSARVQVVLRRVQGMAATDGNGTRRHGPLELRPDSLVLLYDSQRVPLTRAECDLLDALITYPARVFSRDELIRRLYHEAHPVTDRSIDATVKRLRRKMQEIRPGPDPIRTVYGMGYKLNEDLLETSP
jgi:DNA-binding response OmpR family regulator